MTDHDAPRAGDRDPPADGSVSYEVLARLVAADEQYQVLRAEAPVGVVGFDPDLRVTHTNRVIESIMGYEPGAMHRRHLEDFCPADRWPLLHDRLRNGEPGSTYRSKHIRLLHRNGHEVPVQGSATVLGRRGEPRTGSLVVLWDTTRQREAEVRARARFEKLVNFSADIITVFTRDGRLKYTSPQGPLVLGWAVDQLPAGILSTIHPDDLPAATAALEGLFDGTWPPNRPLTFRIRGAEGEWHHFESRGVDLSADPDIAGVVITSRDVTEREALAAQLEHAARHDHLTGLANRAAFGDHLEQALARVERAGTSVGACYVDLDHFKPVNDTYGHAVGDEVLVGVAQRLVETCRQGDLAARVGGDEFVAVIEHVTHDDEVMAFSDRVTEALALPHDTSAGQVHCPGTVGWARSARGEAAEDLLRRADDDLLRRKASR